ncbi:DUF433 domain-containing protein [Nocardia sp. NPDC005366]|uniref:DUF433 domain-containing protein n=1 Tax=Nocardia sp. NPDC005366 TaxID=3156878 RepID=UPI0033AC33A3
MSLLGRITTNPEICHGKPVVRDLRYPVEMLLELLASGMTVAEILGDAQLPRRLATFLADGKRPTRRTYR